jgi:hypothetical protein
LEADGKNQAAYPEGGYQGFGGEFRVGKHDLHGSEEEACIVKLVHERNCILLTNYIGNENAAI